MEYLDDMLEQQETKRELKKLLVKKKIRNVLAVLVIMVFLTTFAVGAAWMAGKGDSKETIAELECTIDQLEKKIQEIVDNPVVVTPVSPVIELDVLNNQIQDIGELATVEYLFTDAARFSDSKQIKNWNIPGTEKSFTVKWDGVIKAGVKVDKISLDVNENEKEITVMIPKAEILSYETDMESMEILDEKNNHFNPISVEDHINIEVETEKEMKQRAIENGILEKAQVSAEMLIGNLLLANPAIGTEYSIEFVVK